MPSTPGVPVPTSPTRSVADRVPPHTYFVTSAVFHYLGPAFAVLLFVHVDVLGVAWLRIATAAVVLLAWRRPWRVWAVLTSPERRLLIALGAVLGVMNCSFYLAIARLPLGTVGAIEFLGPIVLAALALRSRGNAAALTLAIAGVALLTDVHLTVEPWGLAFAFVNCALFMLYVMVAHRLAQAGGPAGIDRLTVAMLIAAVVATPAGIGGAADAVVTPSLLAAGFGVGVCSSVIPYVCDQLAMARLPRATFALMLSLLPATAVLVGLVALRQVPTWAELGGVAFVIGGVALHRDHT